MTFSSPWLLQVGIGLALVVVLAWWRHTVRRRKLADFLGGRPAVRRLSASNLYRIPLERVLLLGVAALLLASAAAEPRLTGAPEIEPIPEPPTRRVVLAIDVSASMQAADEVPTRLGRAVEIAEELLGPLAEDRVGLILFAGSTYRIAPPTHDHDAIRYFLTGIAPTLASAQDPGSLASVAIREAAALLPGGPDEPGARAVVLIGDGESGEPDARVLAAVREAAEDEIVVHTVGVGRTRGAGMVMPSGTFQLGGQIMAPGGTPAVSRLREALLRQIAEDGSGWYAHAADQTRLQALHLRFSSPILETLPPVVAPAWRAYDLTFWFALATLLLVLLESLLDVRLPRRAGFLARRVA